MCLLIEVCLKHGNDEQKTAAKALATNEIMMMEVVKSELMTRQESVDSYTKIFEQILNSSDLDGGANNLRDQMIEAAELASSDSDDDSDEEEQCDRNASFEEDMLMNENCDLMDFEM